MNDGVEFSRHATGMEGPRVKRRKLEQTECAAQGSATDALAGILPESTGLVDHRHDVCFGMIKIEVKTMKPDALGGDGEDFVEISLNIEEDQLIARNIGTQKYGAWLIRNDASTRKKPVYELFIVIYGMFSQKDAIGNALDGAELFLQDPPDQIRGDHSVQYFNPHRLYNPALSDGGNLPHEHAAGVPVKVMKQQKILCETDLLKPRIREVMDSACGPQYFIARQQSPRVRTRLKQYKNTVTGSVQTDFPKLCYGGILADDMGLGKTLTAISLIAASKDSFDISVDGSLLPHTTLIVTPLSLLQTWEEQILNHVHPGQLSYHKYYGASKGDISSLKEYDVVLTTYDTVSNERSKKRTDTVAGLGLGSTEWLRVILDEAHVIRNRSTKRFRAIHALQARFRWCLTGTPIFNRVEDLGSLMGFLGVHPFDSSSTFNSRISNPVVKGTLNGLETLRKLVYATALRRTKDSVHDELSLPERRVVQELVHLTGEERKNYSVLKSSYASILHEDDGVVVPRRFTASIMQTIARLRQFCDHGLDLLPRKVHQLFDDRTTTERVSRNLFDALEACAVCRTPVNEDSPNQESLDCGHYMCSRCQKQSSDEEILVDIVCKLCDQDTAKSGSSSPYPSVQFTAATSNYMPSSKVQALLQNLISERQSCPYQPIKSVVFSCWTKMLDLIQKALIIQGLDFVRIDGSKTEKARREAIARFRGDHSCGILLATIGSAGVGLDLTVASRVHIIEPQWTQTAENQAIDRVHRLGQTQDVIATRYIVKDSIEEYVLTVQDRKATVMRQAFEIDGVENAMSARERLLKYLA
ncbi:hypothetical protein INS49_014758 [Diaporthe citri]|uniref:uncharacterized protein n=1 Tax=Diaporthe citri TaxID=83186 RepID=UPI001C81072A|nr:uncharacterized protein INS49_014758 [Diaporthe citri]KAG6356883.1 hypothetical protein INS49_014758 [Diaporthe citri]